MSDFHAVRDCRVKFNLKIGSPASDATSASSSAVAAVVESGMREEMSNADGEDGVLSRKLSDSERHN